MRTRKNLQDREGGVVLAYLIHLLSPAQRALFIKYLCLAASPMRGSETGREMNGLLEHRRKCRFCAWLPDTWTVFVSLKHECNPSFEENVNLSRANDRGQKKKKKTREIIEVFRSVSGVEGDYVSFLSVALKWREVGMLRNDRKKKKHVPTRIRIDGGAGGT